MTLFANHTDLKRFKETRMHNNIEEPTSQMAESKISVLPYRWQDGKYRG